MKKWLILAALNELRGLICVSLAALALCHAPARAQNSPLSGLAPRGTVQSSDLIPILPAGGSQLMQTTVGAIIAPASAGATGTVQAVNLTVPGFTCATTGTTTLTVTCSLGSGANSSTFLRGDGTWATPAGVAPSGAANLIYATPNGSSGAAALRAMAIPDLPASGVTAGSYASPVSVSVNAAGQVTGIVGGQCLTSCAMPALASFAWVNQGGASATQPVAGGPILITQPDSGASTLAWRGLFMNVPASCPWKVSAAIRASTPLSTSVDVNGLYLTDGTKFEGLEIGVFSTGFQQRVEHITNVSTDGSTVYNGATGWAMHNDYSTTYYVQIRNDCTNLYFDSSLDGVVFANLYSEAATSYLTATKIGFGGDHSQGSSSPLFVSLQGWQAYSDANLNGP